MTKKHIIGFGVAVAVAILLGFLFSGSSQVSQPTTDLKVKGERAGVQNFADGATLGDVTELWYAGTLESQGDQAVIFRNTSGKTVFADFASVNLTGSDTASSSMKVSIFATTTSSVPNTQDFTALVATSTAMIDSYIVATSTTATTTNSVLAAVQAKGNGAVIIPNDWYVLFYMQTNSSVGCSNAGTCETATSTVRGFNPKYKLRIHY